MPDEPLFLDKAYIYALTNPRDQWQSRARHWQARIIADNRRLLTTEFILAEIADGLSAVKFRVEAAHIIHALTGNPLVEVAAASSDLFRQGLELYENRADKDWGLTDCISFVVMTERGLTDALTTDEHFQQAGFRALLLETEI